MSPLPGLTSCDVLFGDTGDKPRAVSTLPIFPDAVSDFTVLLALFSGLSDCRGENLLVKILAHALHDFSVEQFVCLIQTVQLSPLSQNSLSPFPFCDRLKLSRKPAEFLRSHPLATHRA